MANVIQYQPQPNYSKLAIAKFLENMAEQQRQSQDLAAKKQMDDQNNAAALVRQLLATGDVESAQQVAQNAGLPIGGADFVNMKAKMEAEKQRQAQQQMSDYTSLFTPNYTAATPDELANPDLSSQVKLGAMPAGQYGPGNPMLDRRDPLNVRVAKAMAINPPKNADELKAMIAALSGTPDIQALNQIGIGTRMNAKDQAQADLNVDEFNQIKKPESAALINERGASAAASSATADRTRALTPLEVTGKTIENAKNFNDVTSQMGNTGGLNDAQSKIFDKMTTAAEKQIAPLRAKAIDVQNVVDRLSDPSTKGFENYAAMIQIMKSLDDSVVRSEEVRTAMASLGISEGFNQWLARAESGGLTPEFRHQLSVIAQAALGNTSRKIDGTLAAYKTKAIKMDPTGNVSSALDDWAKSGLNAGGISGQKTYLSTDPNAGVPIGGR